MTQPVLGPPGVAATTTTFVDMSDDINPSYLNGPVFARYRASMTIMYDDLADGAALAVRARFPSVAPPDAFPYLGQDRTIYQGFAEPLPSYILRLQQWLDLLPYEGMPTGILCAMLGYVIPSTWTVAAPGTSPMVRTVDDSSNWNTYVSGANPVPLAPVNRQFPISVAVASVTNNGGLFEIMTSSAIQFPTGTSVSINGVVGTGGMTAAVNGVWVSTFIDSTHFTLQNSVFVGAYTSGGAVGSPLIRYPQGFTMLQAPTYLSGVGGGGGNWIWDTIAQPYGHVVPRWWRLWPILYSVSGSPFTTPIATWAPNSGSVNVSVTAASGPTPSFYSGSGSAVTNPTEFAWDDGTCWDWAGTGTGVGYAPAYGQASGFTAIARQWKAANVFIPYVIISYDATYFDPTLAFGSSKLPDGTWSSWAKIVAETASGAAGVPSYYAPSRPANTVCSFIAGSGEAGFGYVGNARVYTPSSTVINVVP